MNIGIDARMMDSSFGLGRYIQQFVTHLIRIPHAHTYVLFFRSKEQYERNAAHFGELPPHVRVVYADIPWYGWKEQLQFPRVIRKEKIDLMHFPHWNVPLLYRKPFLVTIHDLTMFHFPRPEATTLGPLRFWCKDRLSRVVIRSAAHRAKHIISTTEFTKVDMCEHLNVPKEKVTTVYQAPFVHAAHAETDSPADGPTDVKKPFVLYVGAAYPHKNLEGLLKTWQVYCKQYADDITLMLVGRKDYFYDRLCQSTLFAQTPHVEYKGEVCDRVLQQLYSQASVYVFPSLYEGFGLPPLEAMSYGVPVVSSSRSCMPEILGEAALYVDPENPEQFAEAIHRALTDRSIRAVLKEQGREQLKLYSWDRLAMRTVELYETYRSRV